MFLHFESPIGKRQIKFTDDKKSPNKSCFVRKSVLATLGNGKEFKFNFPVNELRQLELNTTTGNDKNSDDTKPIDNNGKCDEMVKQIPFAPTDNSFRFNFDINEK